MTDITTETLTQYQLALQAEQKAAQASRDAEKIYRQLRTCASRQVWLDASRVWLRATIERGKLEVLK